MPGERHYVAIDVTQETMCDLVPMAVQEVMTRFVRTVSPNWPTVRMEIIEAPMRSWSIRLSGEGTVRLERDRRG